MRKAGVETEGQEKGEATTDIIWEDISLGGGYPQLKQEMG